MAIFNPLKKDHAENKTFSYSKDGVTLNFTLRIDIKKQLVAFEEMLVEAIKDVKEQIGKL